MPNKKVRVIPCPSCLYWLLDRWLAKMSLRGWHLIACRFAIVYYFEKGLPRENVYFTWSPSRIGDGKYSISLRHPQLIATYGKKKKASKLNKDSYLNHNTTIEIDIDKINDIGYRELIKDRNILYLMMTIRDILVIGIAICILLFVRII